MPWGFCGDSCTIAIFFFFFVIFWWEKEKENKADEYHSDFRTSPLVPHWDIYAHIPPRASFSSTSTGFCSHNHQLLPQSEDLQLFWWSSVSISCWDLEHPSFWLAGVLWPLLLVTENTPKQRKQRGIQDQAFAGMRFPSCKAIPWDQDSRVCNIWHPLPALCFCRAHWATWTFKIRTPLTTFPHPYIDVCHGLSKTLSGKREARLFFSSGLSGPERYLVLQCCVRGMYFSQHTFDSWEDSLCKRSWELKPSLFPYWRPELLFLMLLTDSFVQEINILSCSHKEHCMRCIWERWRWMHVYLSQSLSGCLSLEIGERMLDLLFSTVKKKKYPCSGGCWETWNEK